MLFVLVFIPASFKRKLFVKDLFTVTMLMGIHTVLNTLVY